MRDDDFVSIVVFQRDGDSAVDFEQIPPVHFINVRHLRETFAARQISITRPKGAEEGSEIRVIWPCTGAKQRSSVSAVESGRIILTSIPDMQRQCIQLSRTKGTIRLLPQVKADDVVEANQITAAVVPVKTSLVCPPTVDEDYFIDRLSSVNLSERYSAAKALRYRGYSAAEPVLVSRMTDVSEDIYVQLEAAAALAAHDDQRGWEYIEQKVHSPVMTVPLETQLETIIVASELHKEQSERLLMEVLENSSRDEELRAGAAWALGQFPSARSATALVDTFNSSPVEVKVEAARALLRIAEPQVSYLVRLLQSSDASKRDGISWVLARTGRFDPVDLIAGADDNLRRWIGYIVGHGKDKFLRTDLEAICKADPEVYFAASVLWQVLASWVNDLTEY
jgi:hypothetical protein